MKWNTFEYRPLDRFCPQHWCETDRHLGGNVQAANLQMFWEDDMVYETFYTCHECTEELYKKNEALLMRFAHRLTIDRYDANGQRGEQGKKPALGGGTTPYQPEQDPFSVPMGVRVTSEGWGHGPSCSSDPLPG